MEHQPPVDSIRDFRYLDTLVDLLDSRFRIPGTNIRFGWDVLLGLVPYVGDVVTLALSGLLVIAMARHGVSGMVVVKMLGNILLDAVVGTIPLLGDIFDVQFKANRRNYRLLREYYHTGQHRGSAWPVVIGVIAALVLMLVGVVMMVWKILQWVFS